MSTDEPEPPPQNSSTFGPMPRCIYCGDASDIESLTDEHIIPGMLGSPHGAQHIISRASCENCRRETSKFESICANEMFSVARARLNLRKRRKKWQKGHMPVVFLKDGKPHTLQVPLAAYPSSLHMPLFPEPGAFRGGQPIEDFEDHRVLSWYIDADFDERLESLKTLTGAKHLYLRASIDTQAFVRMIAKIAHCTAVAQFGINSFRPFLTDIIRYAGTPAAYLIGCVPEDQKSLRTYSGHSTSANIIRPFAGGSVVVCYIRLFTEVNTPEYVAVVGRPTSALLQRVLVGDWHQSV